MCVCDHAKSIDVEISASHLGIRDANKKTAIFILA